MSKTKEGKEMATEQVLSPEEEAEVREAEKAEEAVASQQQNEFAGLLAEAKSVKEELSECDEIIKQAETRKKELQGRGQELSGKIQDTLKDLQKELGLFDGKRSTTLRAPVVRRSGRDGAKPVRQVILEYLEKHREARTSEIKKHLEGLGRSTNPGVELSRMVKDGSIVNVERGVYTMP